ncbi:MAG: phosphatidate cytidylyltransferase [Dehalococcoidia bacterium]
MAIAGVAGANGSGSLARRLTSAAIGIPFLFLFVWVGSFWFVALVAVVAILGLVELYRLSGVQRLWLQRGPGLALVLLLVVNGHTETIWAAPLVAASLPVLLLAYAWTPSSVRPWLLVLAGPLYLGATLAYAVLLRNLDDGALWVALALLSTFSVDTAAFFAGRAFGRHRMVPRISPGKTWEGAVAGLLGGVGATVLLVSLFDLPLKSWEALALGIGIWVVAQAGDLLESALKRAAKAKEAGWLIPGHGGLLDRLDSVVFTLVLVYYGATWGAT